MFREGKKEEEQNKRVAASRVVYGQTRIRNFTGHFGMWFARCVEMVPNEAFIQSLHVASDFPHGVLRGSINEAFMLSVRHFADVEYHG